LFDNTAGGKEEWLSEVMSANRLLLVINGMASGSFGQGYA
jgi:hypothetical protein